MAAPATNVLVNPDPASYAAAVTPSDSTNFAVTARALYIGAAGNVTLVLVDGTSVLFTALNAGTILPVRCIRVNATATTASAIVALY